MLVRNENSRVTSSFVVAPGNSDSVVHARIQNKAFALAVIANVLWGTSFLASKYTLQVWGPFTASTLRFALALVLMAIGFPAFGVRISFPKNLEQWTAAILVGLSGFGFLYPLQLMGLQTVSTSVSASIMLTSPLIVVLLGRFFLSEHFSIQKILAIFLGITGGLLLLGIKFDFISSHIAKGQVLTLAASLSLAASIIITRKFAKNLAAGTITFWSTLAGFLFLLPFALREPSVIHRTEAFLPGIIALVYLGLVCSALCFLLWNSALSLAPAKQLASSMHIKTPVAVLMGVLLAGERLSFSMLCGAIIVGLGVWLSQIPEGVNLVTLQQRLLKGLLE